jgi:hypothetical protein
MLIPGVVLHANHSVRGACSLKHVVVMPATRFAIGHLDRVVALYSSSLESEADGGNGVGSVVDRMFVCDGNRKIRRRTLGLGPSASSLSNSVQA